MTNWVNTDLFFEVYRFHVPVSHICYSPSKRYAMLRVVTGTYETVKMHLVIMDLLDQKVNRKLWDEAWNEFCYCYWLDDSTFAVFSQDKELRRNSHYIYSCNLDDPRSQLFLLNHRHFPFFGAYICCKSKDACKMTINNQDFLLIQDDIYMLCAYDITSTGPLLPVLRARMSTPVGVGGLARVTEGRHLTLHEGLPVTISEGDILGFNVFAYKDKVYFSLQIAESECRTDCFAYFSIEDYNLNSKETLPVMDFNNYKIFYPRKLTKGSYRTKKGTLSVGIWQDGPIVLIYDKKKINESVGDRKIWILNLDEESVSERTIKGCEFYKATIYKRFLQLWSIVDQSPETGLLVFKYIFLNDHVPRLADLCRIQLLSRGILENEDEELLNKCFSF